MAELFLSTTIQTPSYRSDIFLKSRSERIVFRDHQFIQNGTTPHRLIDVQADYWTFAASNFEIGQVSTQVSDEERYHFIGPTVILLPRFSVVEFHLNEGTVKWCYLLSQEKVACSTPNRPYAFKIGSLERAMELIKGPSHQLLEWLQDQRNGVMIERNNYSHVVSARVKQAIDQSFRQPQNLSSVFLALGYSASVASRLFKRTYGLSPVQYRNQLRVMQAGTDLIFGTESVEKAHLGVGIEDPSYFYQRFKEHMNTTPARFRPTNENSSLLAPLPPL